jgi:hypothetical protein
MYRKETNKMDNEKMDKKVRNIGKATEIGNEKITITRMNFFDIWCLGYGMGTMMGNSQKDKVDLFEKSLEAFVNIKDEFQDERIALISKIAEITKVNE